MAKIIWDAAGTHFYETGTDHAVLYVREGTEYGKGVAWNGITAVTESPSGSDVTDLWADNIKYATMRAAETFGGTIEAYIYPEEFAECDGTAAIATGVYVGQQARKYFGFSYRTKIGSDTISPDSEEAYKLHIIYGASASPSEKSYATINDSPDAITFSWEFDTTPVNVTGHKATSCITIDSTKADKIKLAALEDILYGTESEEARLPLPDEVIELMSSTTGG